MARTVEEALAALQSGEIAPSPEPTDAAVGPGLVRCSPCNGRGGFAGGLQCRTCDGKGEHEPVKPVKWIYIERDGGH